MSARELAIGFALQELGPEVTDLMRMARLVSAFASDELSGPVGGVHTVPYDDMETLMFGIADIHRKAKALNEAFERAFSEAPAA